MKVAVAQQPPVLLNREATLRAVVSQLHAAADEEASLVVFPEAYVPGYPVWIWRLRPQADYQLTTDIHAALVDNSVDLALDGLGPVREAAASRSVIVVIGIHERDGQFSRSTLYNSLVVIGADGRLLNRHRKLMPTNPERMVWGQGDGSGLRVVESGRARLGGLICWENYMPLARYALYSQGVEVYVASTWDSGDTWISTMRHIAAEGRCWVIGSGCAIRASDVPPDFPGHGQLFPNPEEVINPGDSLVVAPGGEVVAGPMHDERGLLMAEIDPSQVAAARRTLDVAGHYGRDDVFHLSVDRSARTPLSYLDGRGSNGELVAAELTEAVDLGVRCDSRGVKRGGQSPSPMR